MLLNFGTLEHQKILAYGARCPNVVKFGAATHPEAPMLLHIVSRVISSPVMVVKVQYMLKIIIA